MLADEGHGSGLYLQTIIEVLHNWVNKYEIAQRKGDILGYPKEAVSCSRTSSVFDKHLRKYFISGDLIDVVHPAGF